MSSSDATGETSASLQNIPATYARLKRHYQQTLDRITPHILYRWVGTTVTIAIFELRIVYAQGVRVPPNLRIPSLMWSAPFFLFDMYSGILVRHSSVIDISLTPDDYLQFAVSRPKFLDERP
jgi:hypothetical protein